MTPQARDDPGRHESEEEREDRNLAELLQELRIAGLGVQVLFGFLLSLPFTTRFGSLDQAKRDLYLITLLLAALAVALLAAPVAYHRLVFRQHLKSTLLAEANVMAVTGLGAVGLAVTGAIGLVTSVMARGAAVPIVAGTLAGFCLLWFLLPLAHRVRGRRARDSAGVHQLRPRIPTGPRP